MKVCLDMTSLNNASRFRGIGMYCLELARAVSVAPWPRGLELFFLVAGPGPRMRVVPCEPEVVRRWEAGEFGPLFMHNVYYLLKHTVAWARLGLSDMDLVHAMEPKGTSRAPGCKVLVTCHDMIPALSEAYESLWPVSTRTRFEGWRMAGIDHAIAISENTRDELLRVSGWDPARVSVVYHGVDTGVFKPEAAPGETTRVRELTGQRPYLFYVGGYDLRKQVPQLVEAFCRRLGELDQDLVLAGRMSPGERRALDALIPAGARPRVRFCGYVAPDLLPALYRHATAHVTPSIHEGFGMTLTEAFACGCPVVATAASCIPEIAGDAALLVPPRNRDALGDALVRICSDDGLRAKLRERGRRRGERFTWSRCAEDTLAVYQSLLARSSPLGKLHHYRISFRGR